MPLHLEPIDVSADLKDAKSVLIVSCPVCPPVSLATEKKAPFMEFFKSGIKTGAYEDCIKEIRTSLEQRGAKTGVFTSYVPCAATCLWTKGQRNRLLKRAGEYEAALVMGCDSAKYTVEETLKDTNCRVIPGMRLTGITNASLKFGLPLTVQLEHPVRISATEIVREESARPEL